LRFIMDARVEPGHDAACAAGFAKQTRLTPAPVFIRHLRYFALSPDRRGGRILIAAVNG